MADATLAVVRRVMNWHAARSDDFRSPIVRGMARTKPHERARERVLTDDELRSIWRAADGSIFGSYLRFLLLTAARRNEAAMMERAELAGTNWTLPAARNKTKVDLVRLLSALALATITALPPCEGPLVFIRSGMALGSFGRLKAEFDGACGVKGWTLHDLRRTARSLMSRAGVPSDHAERCLGPCRSAGSEGRMIGTSIWTRNGSRLRSLRRSWRALSIRNPTSSRSGGRDEPERLLWESGWATASGSSSTPLPTSLLMLLGISGGMAQHRLRQLCASGDVRSKQAVNTDDRGWRDEPIKPSEWVTELAGQCGIEESWVTKSFAKARADRATAEVEAKAAPKVERQIKRRKVAGTPKSTLAEIVAGLKPELFISAEAPPRIAEIAKAQPDSGTY